MQPVYALPWVPSGHNVVWIVSAPPDAVTVTLAVAVVDPALLVAVRV